MASPIQRFAPVITQSSPSRRANVVMLPGSDPEPGSVSPKHPMTSPAAMRGSQCVLLLLAAVLRDRAHRQRTLHRHERAQTRVPRLQLGGRQPVLDRAAARAAVALDVHAQQPELRRTAAPARPGTPPPRTTRRCAAGPRRRRTRAPSRAQRLLVVGQQRVDRQQVVRVAAWLSRYRRLMGSSAPRRLSGRRPQPRARRPDRDHDARRSRRPRHQSRAPRTIGDDTRQFGPPWAGSSSAYFESANRSKESIALDFADAGDLRARARTRSTAPTSSSRTTAPERCERFGLDAASVRARNPRVIYASDHRVRERGGSGRAGLRLPGAGGRRADEHHRRAGRRTHQGRRRHDRPAGRERRRDGSPRRASCTANAPATASTSR